MPNKDGFIPDPRPELDLYRLAIVTPPSATITWPVM